MFSMTTKSRHLDSSAPVAKQHNPVQFWTILASWKTQSLHHHSGLAHVVMIASTNFCGSRQGSSRYCAKKKGMSRPVRWHARNMALPLRSAAGKQGEDIWDRQPGQGSVIVNPDTEIAELSSQTSSRFCEEADDVHIVRSTLQSYQGALQRHKQKAFGTWSEGTPRRQPTSDAVCSLGRAAMNVCFDSTRPVDTQKNS